MGPTEAIGAAASLGEGAPIVQAVLVAPSTLIAPSTLMAQTAGLLRFAQATAVLALVLAVAAFAFWLVKRLHGNAADDTLAAHDSLSNFRELHARGGLSDEEFRTIKTKLARELDAGLGDSAESEPLQE
ncbi:MAG: hypothetical protein AAGJ46_14575 [Planctomycetota bacterium]